MLRRQYIAVSVAAGLAGCSGSPNGEDNGSTDTSDPDDSSSDTTDSSGGDSEETTDSSDDDSSDDGSGETTESTDPPEVLTVNLISEFEDFGDVEDKMINNAPQNSDVLIGWRERTWVHEGTYATTSQVEIRNAQGNRVAVDSSSEEQIVEGDGPEEWEGAIGFLASWEPGDYSAEVVIRDDVTDKVSEPVTGTFTITEPEPKLEILEHSRYTEEYDEGVRGVAKNVSDATLSYAEVSVVFLNSDGQQIEDNLDNVTDLASGREWQFEMSNYADDDFASYELSVDWSV